MTATMKRAVAPAASPSRLPRQRLLWLAAAAVAATPVLITARLGLENRFLADDYSTAARFTQLGFFGSLVDQLRVLNGRFAGYFVTDVLTLLGPRGAWVATWAVLGLLTAMVVLALPSTTSGWPARLATGMMLTSAFVLFAPAPEQSFLWIAGAGMLTVSIAFAVGSVAAARVATDATGGRRRVLLGAALVLGLLASGSYETTAVVMVAGAGAVALAAGFRSRGFAPILAVGIGAALGLLIVALLPGSATRKDVLARGVPLVTALPMAWDDLVDFVAPLVRAEPIWIAFGVGLLLAPPAVPWPRALRWGSLVIGAGLLGAYGAFVLSSWSLGGPPPDRTMTVHFALAIAVVFFVGWLVPAPSRTTAPLAVAVLLAIVHQSAPRVAQIDDRAAWARAWDRRDAQLRSAPPDQVVSVAFLDSGAGLEEISADSTSWVNEAAAKYYGVSAIQASPGG